jgi:membrane-associated protease RseP (regulator of RpoE activity)
MFSSRYLRRAGWLAAVAGVLLSGALVQAQEAQRAERIVVIADKDEEGKPGGYWLGVQCTPPSDALRAQLDLPEGHGLVIEQVIPDSPAAKAGLEKHDVLLSAGGKALDEVGALSKIVSESEGKELALDLIRKGKKLTIQVTPGQRPKDQEGLFERLPMELDHEVIKWLQRFRQGAIDGQPGERLFGFDFARPGVIVGRIHADVLELPKNTTISITKTGDSPAKITVRQDDKTYETTEDKLDALPENVRGYVQRMLKPGALYTPRGDLELKVPRVVRPVPHNVEIQAIPAPGPKIEKRLDDLQKKIEELQKAVDKLREDKPTA